MPFDTPPEPPKGSFREIEENPSGLPAGIELIKNPEFEPQLSQFLHIRKKEADYRRRSQLANSDLIDSVVYEQRAVAKKEAKLEEWLASEESPYDDWDKIKKDPTKKAQRVALVSSFDPATTGTTEENAEVEEWKERNNKLRHDTKYFKQLAEEVEQEGDEFFEENRETLEAAHTSLYPDYASNVIKREKNQKKKLDPPIAVDEELIENFEILDQDVSMYLKEQHIAEELETISQDKLSAEGTRNAKIQERRAAHNKSKDHKERLRLEVGYWSTRTEMLKEKYELYEKYKYRKGLYRNKQIQGGGVLHSERKDFEDSLYEIEGKINKLEEEWQSKTGRFADYKR